MLKRSVGGPPHEVRRYYASFRYQAASWTKLCRVVAKVEWHPGELYSRVGFIVTNMTHPAERVVMSYNHRGTVEQWIKESKNAVTWTRLSCQIFKANAVRLQLHALAYNLANFLRTLAPPAEMAQWSLSTLRDWLVKIQMAEMMVPRALFQKILAAIAALRPLPLARFEYQRQTGRVWLSAGGVRPDAGVRTQISADTAIVNQSARLQPSPRSVTVATRAVLALNQQNKVANDVC